MGIQYELDQVAKEHAVIWNQACKSEKEANRTSSSLDMVKQPEPFKGETKWRQWKESMFTYRHPKIGHANIPLAFILRENDMANYNKFLAAYKTN